MALASLMALALLAADAPPASGSPDINAPIATQAPRSVTPPPPAAGPAPATGALAPIAPNVAASKDPTPKDAKPKTAAQIADEEPLPNGAPADDYGFVAWCSGALRGHMDLFEVVKPTLNALPDPDPKMTAASDAEMLEAGAQYLALYEKALDAAQKASPQPIAERAAELKKTGRKIWGAAEMAEPKTRMWSWAMWVLPGRCEYAAERLYEKSMLKGQALGVNMRTAPIKKAPKKPERNALGSIER